MERLKVWMYRHPVLALLLPYLPCAVIFEGLFLMGVLDPFLSTMLSVLALFLIAYPVRRIPRQLMAESIVALDRDCDPERFLKTTRVLLSRPPRNGTAKLVLRSNYAAGVDAAGYPKEALEILRAGLSERAILAPVAALQFDISYASIAMHTESGREELPRVIAEIDANLAQIDPQTRTYFLDMYLSLQKGMQFHRDELGGLVDYYVGQIEKLRANPMNRRRLMAACMWLARVYDRAGRYTDARVMYRYVIEQGNRLGIVEEARTALLQLDRREQAAPKENEVPAAENEASQESVTSAENEAPKEKEVPTADTEEGLS